MPRRHRDNSTRLNLERNLGISGRYAPNDDNSLWRQAREAERNGRPIVDRELEENVDKASRAFARKTMVNEDNGIRSLNFNRPDSDIKEDVNDALNRAEIVDAKNITVEVHEGCVYLSGHVESRQIKKMAEDIAEGVKGVVDIQNQLMPKKADHHLGRKISSLEDLGSERSL